MRLANYQLDHVYEVVTAIPAIGARPRDELVVRPTDPDFPLTVTRTFDLEMLAAIPDAAVTFLAAYEPGSKDPVSEPAVGPGLRLVR